MEINCPNCKSNDIFKRKTVSRHETHTRKAVNGIIMDVRVDEPKFYLCYRCGKRFNVK